MQFERLLNLIEDATDANPTDVTGKLLRFPVTQKIDVKFRTNQLQSLSKRQSKLPRLAAIDRKYLDGGQINAQPGTRPVAEKNKALQT